MFAIKGGGVGMDELGEGEKKIGKNVWDLDLDNGYMGICICWNSSICTVH